MNLCDNETIFDKMKIPYNELRKSDNAVGEVVKYYKSQLKEGESLWWTDSSEVVDESVAISMNVRLWSNLTEIEETDLLATLFALFPEMLSLENNKKYNRAVVWLVTRHGIVDSSFRDKFSAGGKVSITTANGIFYDLPRVFKHIKNFTHEIQGQIERASASELRETWQAQTIESDRLSQWIRLAGEEVQVGKYPAVDVLKAIFEVEF
jgi:hypothetical protein